MKQRTKRFRKLLLLPLLIVGLLFQTQAFAADGSCTVSIPVGVEITGESVPTGIDYTVTITPADESNPMPDASSVTITDSGTAALGPITYTKPGDYVYTVTQQAGDVENVTYDTTNYTVTVRVVNDGEGGLTAEMWVVEEDGTDKVGEILFHNTYDAPVTPDPTPKPTPTPTPTKPTATKTSATVKSASPKTGDETNLVVLGCLMGVSLIGLVGLTAAFYWKKKRS